MTDFRLTSFRAAYLAGLALIALMVMCQFAGTRFLSAKQEVSALEINLSGRQRMLSQRTALEIKRLSTMNAATPAWDEMRARAIILACTELIEASHVALVERNPERMRQVLASGQDCLQPGYDLEMRPPKAPLAITDAPVLAQFAAKARAVALGEIGRDEIDLNFVSEPTLTALLTQLDRATRETQEFSVQQVQFFLTIGWLILFALIAGEIIFIFQPMVRSVEASMKKLRDANEQLCESEKRFQDFASIGAHQFWETDKEHRFKWVGAAGQHQNSLDPDLFLTRHRWEMSAKRNDGPQVDWTGHRATLDAKLPFENFEYPVELPDGTLMWWRVHGAPMFNLEGEFEGYRGTSSDITQERKAELVARHAERMSALGQLTAGVAHDFNNLLSVIRGNAELMAIETDAQERAVNVSAIVAAVERGASLTERLLAFGRVQKLKAEPIEIAALFSDMSELLNRTLGEDFSVQMIMPENPLFICVDRHQLEDAFVNLALNARDACGPGGKLVIEATSHTRAVRMPVSGQSFGSGELVCISFKDNGCGISSADVNRIFEPFFTTKPVGAGSGLGLSMVYGFALQSDGFVDVASTPGQGTQVFLCLPKSDDMAPELRGGGAQAKPAAVPGHRVLLLEDNDAFRRVARKMLERLGLEVVDADDAAPALAALRTRGPFDLLIADVLLPGPMNGIEAAKHARSVQPGLPILFSSGFTGAGMDASVLADFPEPILRKPYSQTELADRVGQLLGAVSELRAGD